MTVIAAGGPGRRGTVYCEVDGVATEIPVDNLRQEGLFVPTPEPLPVDREVELFLRSSAGEVVLRGLVVQAIGCAEAAAQRRVPGYGVLFLDVSPEARTFITRTRSTPERVETRAPGAQAAPPRTSARPRASTQQRTETLAQLEATLAALKGRSPSETLGLDAAQDVDAAHRAFLALSKRYHPHAFAHLDSAEVTRLATEIFITYKRAYAAIRATKLRSDPPRALSLPPPPAHAGSSDSRPSLRSAPERASMPARSDPMLRRIADAELSLAAGLRDLAASRFEPAESAIAKAAALAPERTDIATWLHVCRARGHKARGEIEDALAQYRKALELDPTHREAREVVERGDRRRGGLVSKWLGRNDE